MNRHISRDGGFPVGSEATSTGYVSDSVDGYDKCKGLESEHGTCGTSGSGCGRSQKDGFDSSIGEPIKNELKTVEVLLETSVTNAVSAKLNLNIKYDDDDEEVEQSTPEVTAVQTEKVHAEPEVKNKSEREYVYVAEDDTEEDDEEESSDATEDVSQTGGYSQTPMHTSKNSDSNMSDSGNLIQLD